MRLCGRTEIDVVKNKKKSWAEEEKGGTGDENKSQATRSLDIPRGNWNVSPEGKALMILNGSGDMG